MGGGGLLLGTQFTQVVVAAAAVAAAVDEMKGRKREGKPPLSCCHGSDTIPLPLVRERAKSASLMYLLIRQEREK